MIQGKKIVITGGSSGIGKAIVDLLAAEKTNTIIVAARSAAKLSGYGDNVILFPCDVSKKEGVDELFIKINECFDKCDIFIANAGAPYYEKYDYVNWDRVEAIMNLNTISPIYTYTKYMNHLNGKEGRLVYTISAMGEMAIPGYALYTSTKFAMKGFQQAIRLEMPKNMKMTCIYPVSTATNFFKVGGSGIEVEKAFPVQKAETVAKVAVKAIEKGKKQVYPCAIFRPSKVLMTLLPFVRALYWKNETKRLERFLDKKAQAKNVGCEYGE